ncbi:Ig-like domain-containing protein [Haloferula sp. A504]|uniref:Ig-like domain-containing protein n=1 Tax=Haloferula sp. A504 TaxID=3373601 RepID=UPI0031C4B785|nr:Ig-like domain-containing protein [Verrucomicrobiaceae bacterium E54]
MRNLIGGSDGNPQNTTEAEAIMALEASTGAYLFTDHTESPDPSTINVGGGGSFGATNPLPNGNQQDNKYVLRATANVIIPAGNWTIGFGSDDGGTLKIPGVNFSTRVSNSGSFAADEVRYEGTRGHQWTFGQVTLNNDLETSLEAIMFESGGGDSWEIAIFQGHTTSFNSGSWNLLADGVHGWTVQVEPLNDPNPPVISSSIPEDNSTDNYGGASLVATFDEEIEFTGGGTITLTDLTDGSDIRTLSLPDPQVSVSGTDLTIAPSTKLEYDTEYEVTISDEALQDTWTNPAPNVYRGTTSGEWTFRTAPLDPVPPLVASFFPFFPAPGTTDVDLIFDYPTAPSVAFNKPIVLGTGSIILRNLTRGEDTAIPTTNTDQLIVGDFASEDDLLTILPAEPLDPASDYAVIIEPNAVLNRSGEAFAGISDPTTWYFQTAIVTVYSPPGPGTTTGDSWSDPDSWTVAVPRDEINVEIFATKSATSDGGLADPYTGDLFLGSASLLQIGYQSPRYQEDFNALGTPGETTIFMLSDSELRFRAGDNNGASPTVIPGIELLGDARITMNEGSEPAEDFEFAHGFNGPHRLDLRGNGGQDALLTAPNTFSELVISGNGGAFDVFAQATGSLGGNVTIKSFNGGPAANLFINAADAIDDSAAVALNGDTGSTLITMSADDSVNTLTINSFPYPAGTYGRVGTPATVDNEVTWIAGDQVLTVLSDTGGSGDPIFLEITDDTSDGEVFISQQPVITFTLEFDNPGTFNGGTGAFFSLGSATVSIDSVTQISDQAVEVVVTAFTTGTVNLQTTGAASFDDLFGDTLSGPFVDDTIIAVRDVDDVSGQLGILDLTRNNGINPATGALWKIGDTYRLVFCTSSGISAISSNITTYNNFVQTLADASPLGIGTTEGVTWKAIASTPSISARDNASLDPNGTGTSVWLVDGTTCVADDYADLFGDGTMNVAIGKSETGGQPLYAGTYRDVWTGSDTSGNIKDNDALGAADGTSKGGLITNWRRGWIDRFSIDKNEVRPLYGISNLLTVTSTLPPAPEIAVRQDFTNLVSGTSSYEFGTFGLNTDNDLVFTIYNFGDAPLNLTGSPDLVAVSGDPDFTIIDQPDFNPVPTINGLTTFTLRFRPQASGARSATISIPNDDSDEAPFTFTVTGTGNSQSPYEAWAGTGGSFAEDDNGDGIANGMAWLLGASDPGVNATGLLPAVSEDGSGNLVMSFSMRNAGNRGTSTLHTQHSSDLGMTDAWDAAGNQALVPDIDGTVNGVVFDITAGDPLNTVEATIPGDQANGGRTLFGRLLATE